jgi:hypothetical protein
MNRLLDLELFPLQIVHQHKVDWRPVSQENRIRFLIFLPESRAIYGARAAIRAAKANQPKMGCRTDSPCSHGRESLNCEIIALPINAMREIGGPN